MDASRKYVFSVACFMSLAAIGVAFMTILNENAELALKAKTLPTCPQDCKVDVAAMTQQQDFQRCQADLKSCSDKPSPTQPPRCILTTAQNKAPTRESLTPIRWAEEWEGTLKLKYFRPGAAAALFSFIVVKEVGSGYEIINQEPSTTGQARVFSSPASEEVKSILESNLSVDPESGGDVNGCTTSLKRIFDCFEIDSVVDISKSDWKVVVLNQAMKKTSEVLTARAGDSLQVEAWLRSNLRYDGVVLDRRGRSVLVQLPRGGDLGEGTQAFAWKESHAMFGIGRDNWPAGALLQLVAKEGKYGIFTIPVRKADISAVRPGTKLRIWPVLENAQIAH